MGAVHSLAAITMLTPCLESSHYVLQKSLFSCCEDSTCCRHTDVIDDRSDLTAGILDVLNTVSVRVRDRKT